MEHGRRASEALERETRPRRFHAQHHARRPIRRHRHRHPRSLARGAGLLPRIPPPLAQTLRARLAEAEQMLFGMLLAAIPREEICRVLGITEHELGARAEAMLHTLEALPGKAHAGRRPR